MPDIGVRRAAMTLPAHSERPGFMWGVFRQPVPGKPHHFMRYGVWWVYEGKHRG